MRFKSITLLMLLIIIVLSSCMVYKEDMLSMSNAPISTKLPALTMTYGNFSSSVSYADACSCELNMLSEEVENNLTEFYGEHYGYISFQIHQVDYGREDLYLLPTIFSLGLINILGFPAMAHMREIELKVSIMDSRRQLLKKYSSRAKSRVWVAYYYGYRGKYAPLLINSFVLNKAMTEIRELIQIDAVDLREKLLSAGPIKDN